MADYTTQPNGVSAPMPNDAPFDDSTSGYFEIGRLRRQYYDYLGVKMAEIEEQKEARRYYHGAQWSEKELKILKRRRQPAITSNRIGRKIDAVTGLVERLRQDPKAFPRSPDGQQGSDVATATLRYALDHVDWKSKSSRVARYAAIDGLCGIELDLAYGDRGDPDLDLHIVYPDTFFYDPRSIDDGFTDARFQGVSKWVDIEQAKELVPGRDDEIDGLTESGSDLTPNSDREITWINTSAKKVRLIDHWYVNRGKWCWALYIGNAVLMEGDSPYVDERNRSFPKYLMFSAGVDHDGDRYGFVRNMKGAQDEINHRRSKGLHILNSRRIIAEKGAVDDVERARGEWAKPDGWIEVNPKKEIKPEDQGSDFAGQLQMLQEAKNEIENFGPNPALIGQGIENSSGRAISLLQQAGIAELGPYIISYRTWKIRVYRAIWNIIQRYWTAERWIRVTDDEGLAQFIQLNGVGLDQYGHPAVVNGVGSLDVDIILDEGPDTLTMAQDVFEALQQILPSIAPLLSPAQAAAALGILIESAALPSAAKTKFKQASEQPPDPAQAQAKQIAIEGEAAKIDQTKSATAKNYASAAKTLHDAHLDAREALMASPANQLQALSAPGPGPAPPPGGTPPGPSGGAFGPVPGAVQPPAGGDVPQMPQPPPMGFPGAIPPGALAR